MPSKKSIGRYSFIPAAIKYREEGGTGVYVKYKRHRSTEIRVISTSPTCDIIDCPDRILYVVNDTNKKIPWVPYEECDAFYSYSLYHHSAAADFGIDTFMINSLDEIASNSPANHKPNDSKIKIIADSGGFQFSAGQFFYINPRNLVEWYNTNVDYGIVLDIPLNINSDTWKEIAAIQNKNTEIMLQHKTPELELVNIIHGRTLEDRRNYRSLVEKEEINRVALGGLQARLPLEMLNAALDTITVGKQYEHYHVLGLAQSLKALLLIYLANTGVCKYITFDAASSTLHAVNNAMLVLPGPNAPMRPIRFAIQAGYHHSPFSTLPCNCPVCQTLKYTDIFSILSGHKKVALLALHNLITYTRYFKMMHDIFVNNTLKDVKKYTEGIFSKRDHIDFCLGLNFIEEFREKGLAKAGRRYHFYIQQPKALTDSLFADSTKKQHFKIISKYYRKRPKVFLIKNETVLKTKKKKVHMKPRAVPTKLRGLKR